LAVEHEVAIYLLATLIARFVLESRAYNKHRFLSQHWMWSVARFYLDSWVFIIVHFVIQILSALLTGFSGKIQSYLISIE